MYNVFQEGCLKIGALGCLLIISFIHLIQPSIFFWRFLFFRGEF